MNKQYVHRVLRIEGLGQRQASLVTCLGLCDKAAWLALSGLGEDSTAIPEAGISPEMLGPSSLPRRG